MIEPKAVAVSVQLQWEVKTFMVDAIPVGLEPFHYMATRDEKGIVTYEWAVCKRSTKKVVETTEKYGRTLTAVYDAEDPRAREAIDRSRPSPA